MFSRTVGAPSVALTLMAALVAVTGPAAAAPPRPDLVVAKVKVRGAMVVGESVKITDVTRNRGRARAKASVTGYYLSKSAKKRKAAIRLGQRRVARLKPGKKSRGTTQVRIPARTKPGRYHLLVCADAKRKVRESNERNNCRVASKRKYAVSPPVEMPYKRIEVRIRGSFSSTITYRSKHTDHDHEATVEVVDGTGYLDTMNGVPVALSVAAPGRTSIKAKNMVRMPDGCSYVESDYAGFGWEALTSPVGWEIQWANAELGSRDVFQLRFSHKPDPRADMMSHRCDGTVESVGKYAPSLSIGNDSDKHLTYTATISPGLDRLDFTLHEPVSGVQGDGSPWTQEERTAGSLTLEPLTR